MRGVAAIVGLLVLAVLAQIGLLRQRPTGNPALAESAFAAFGGLRSIASEVVWFRADRLQDEGRYVELAQLAQALTLSDPHTPEVWSYAAWNLAYNISVMMTTPEDRWRWVSSAIRLLRDSGLKYNPESSDIHRELAMIFEMKIAIDIDSAAASYRRYWRQIVEDVASRNAWSELRMDPERMADMERRYGVTDRGDAAYSALYWALEGLRCPEEHSHPYLHEVVRQCVALYRKSHGDGNG